MVETAVELSELAHRLGVSLEQAERGEQASLSVAPGEILLVLKDLKENGGYEMLTDLTAVDWLGKRRDIRFEIVYQLLNLSNGRRLRLKSPVATNEEHPSITELWPVAGFPEREVYDQFGITFTGHPDLRRLLNPDDFEGHPLRKDFPLRGRGYRDDFPNYTRDLLEPNS